MGGNNNINVTAKTRAYRPILRDDTLYTAATVTLAGHQLNQTHRYDSPSKTPQDAMLQQSLPECVGAICSVMPGAVHLHRHPPSHAL